MSWWVYLRDPETGETVAVARHVEGGTYVMGGIEEAELNITYNYGGLFREAWPEALAEDSNTLREMLDERVADETIEPLMAAIGVLGVKKNADYWASTPGNAGYALSILAAWAVEHRTAVWKVH